MHTAGLEHGDFKPLNVLVGNDGRVKVVDFGVARHLAGRVDGDLDVTGKGTRSYMAPERLLGRPSDARADVFSYCVAVWEALYAPVAGAVGAVADRLNALQFLTIRQFLSLVFCALVLLLLVLAI